MLRGWHPSKSRWTGALHILVDNLAKGVWSTGTFLRAGVDTLEADANFIGRAVAVAPAANGAHSIAADLAGWTLLAGYAGDHAHAVAALLSYQTVILAPAGDPALSSLAGGPPAAVSIGPAALAVTDAGPRVQRARDESFKALALGSPVSDGAFCVRTA